MEFETEEQQVEALKKWWKENGKQVIFGAVIGFGVIFGWRYYLDYTTRQSAEASALFEQIANVDEATKSVDKLAVYDKIKSGYSSTPYEVAANLVIASSHYKAGEKEKAINVLDEIITNKKFPVLALIATERKARILIDMGKADDALGLLEDKSSPAFDPIFSELKGDAFVLKGDLNNARQAYDKALSLSKSGKQLLQMKRDNLGNVKSESAA